MSGTLIWHKEVAITCENSGLEGYNALFNKGPTRATLNIGTMHVVPKATWIYTQCNQTSHMMDYCRELKKEPIIKLMAIAIVITSLLNKSFQLSLKFLCIMCNQDHISIDNLHKFRV